MKFTERKLEMALAELLDQQGLPQYLGSTLSRKPDEILIEKN